MFKTRNLGTYRDLLVLFTKYGRRDFRLSLEPTDLVAAATEHEREDLEPLEQIGHQRPG